MAVSAEVALRAFILDYLNKRGLTHAAKGLRVDHQQKGEQPIPSPPVNSPNGFLFEWFGLFWDVFSTRLGANLQKVRSPNHPQHPHLSTSLPSPGLQGQPPQQTLSAAAAAAALQASQNPFPHPSHHPRRTQNANPHLNQQSFRTNAPQIPHNAQQLHNQQLPQQQHHHQQNMLHAQRPPQQSAPPSRIRNAQVDNRRSIPQSSLNLHPLSLDPTLQKQTIPPDSVPPPALTPDMLDVNGTLDGIFSTVGTRNNNNIPRQNQNANQPSATAMMPQPRVSRSQPQPISNTSALANAAAAAAGQTIPRGYTNMQIVGSEAPSTASRRGTLEMPVNRPYEETVEDESQPRAGPNRTSSTMLTKKRPASQAVNRKQSASPADGALSPQTAFATGVDANPPNKRQGTAAPFQNNVRVSPAIHELQQHHKQIEFDQIPGALHREVSQPLPNARGRSAQLTAQQRQKAMAQVADRGNGSQFLPQHAGATKPLSRNSQRYLPRQGSGQSRASLQGQDNRRRDNISHAQVSNGRRSTNIAISQTGTAQIAAGSNAVGEGMPANAETLRATNEGMLYMLRNKIEHVQLWQDGNSSLPIGQMSANAPGGKKPQGNVQSSMGGSKDDLAANAATENDKQVDGAQMTEQMHRDTQLLLERSGMKDDAAHRLRQPFVREDLLKQAGTLPMNDQDISLIPDKPGKIGDGAIPQNGKQGNGNSDDPNRAIKTIETGGGSHTRASSELSNGKPSGFPPPRASTPQNTHGSSTTAAKRDKGSIDDLENRSTKSDRPASRGGGTPSQKSTASGGSGAIDKRTSQGTSSGAPRRGRGRSRVRGTGASRRGRAERSGAARSTGASRSANPSQRSAASVQKQMGSMGLPIGAEPGGQAQGDSNDADMSSVGLIAPPRTSSHNTDARGQSVDARGQNAKSSDGARSRPPGKHVEEQPDLNRAPKLPFDNDDGPLTDPKQFDPSIERQSQAAHAHLHGEAGQTQLLDMLQSTSHPQRPGNDGTLDQVDKAFSMQQLSMVSGAGNGKMGNQTTPNYSYDLPYLTSGVEEETDLGNMLNNMQDNLGLEGPSDFEEGNLLGVSDPSDLGIAGRNRM